MKKLLFLSIFTLVLVTLVFGAEPRQVFQQIQTGNTPSWTWVDAPATDPHYLLRATYAGITYGTDSPMPQQSYFMVSNNTDFGGLLIAQIDQAAWPDANTWVAGQTVTMNIWYRANLADPFDTATMPTSSYSFVVPEGFDPIINLPALGIGTDIWTIPPFAPTTFTLTVNSNPTGAAIWKDGVDTGFFAPHVFDPGEAGSYTGVLAGYTFDTIPVPALTANQEITLTGTPVVVDHWTYNLQVNGPDGYAVTGPFPGTTDYFATTGPLSVEGNTMVGDYTIGAAPMYTHWAVNPINVTAGMFTGAKVEHTYNATIGFVLVDNIYTVSIGASTPAGAAIWFNGVDTGFTAPHDFTGTAAQVFGVYTLKFPGYQDTPVVVNENNLVPPADQLVLPPLTNISWNVYTDPEVNAEIFFDGISTGFFTPHIFSGAGLPPANTVITVVLAGWEFEPIDYNGLITENGDFPFYGTEIQTPVELSSFTATLTADLYVTLTWVSESETNMTGYRVYRNTTNDQATAELIDHPFVPAHNTSTTQVYNVTDEDVTVGTYYYWLESVEYNSSDFHGPVSVTVENNNITPVVPQVTMMESAYPNPFRTGGSTNIKVTLKDSGTVTIYNILGQVVRTYAVNQGTNTITWNGKDSRGNACGNGIYFYKLSTPSYNETKKLVIVK